MRRELIIKQIYNDKGFEIGYVETGKLVRCRDCKHYNDGDCTELPKLVGDDDFCSFGEKKEDE